MKKFFFILFSVLTLNGFAQIPVTALIDDRKDLVAKTITGSKAEFILFAGEEQMNFVKAEAEKYAAYMKLTTKDVSFMVDSAYEGAWECTLDFTHEVQVIYIHKMLLTFGTEKFIYKGQTYPINELMNVVKK